MDRIITLFLMFFKIGLTSFGGGYGMMSMIMDEGHRLVGLTRTEFADMTALDLICSGPVAINAATYIGYIKGGFLGAIFSTMGCVLPSVIICAMVIIFLNNFNQSKIVKGLFAGITPACGGLLLYTTLSLSKSVFFNADSYKEVFHTPITAVMLGMAGLTGAAIIADLKFKINPAYLTLAGAILGMLFLSK